MFILIQTTVASKKEARSLIDLLLEKKLIACAQISKIESIYMWRDEFYDEKEYRLSFKTTKQHLQEIQQLILGHHSYDLAEFTVFDIEHNDKYGKWVKAVTHSKD
ncbi:divalent-cation tolerance protein CutA [Campylobacter troglodytis]|uniref:divalent-cation tolerance protein CutA n=1 Tax=Campylobacter troglodytis TaxID=654363 RepID=UPI00163BD56C|nr:divalent-cation tolerance protein CutA [Campylobacter troglodytis]